MYVVHALGWHGCFSIDLPSFIVCTHFPIHHILVSCKVCKVVCSSVLVPCRRAATMGWCRCGGWTTLDSCPPLICRHRLAARVMVACNHVNTQLVSRGIREQVSWFPHDHPPAPPSSPTVLLCLCPSQLLCSGCWL